MGEMADEAFDRMMDEMDNFSYRNPYYSRPSYRSNPPTVRTPKVKTYPEKTFDMGFFPTAIPKPKLIEEPKEEVPDPWSTDGDAPF